MRLWVGSRTVNDALVPETPEYAGSKTGDLASVPPNSQVPAGPIRVAAGVARSEHEGFGMEHLADNARRDARRMPEAQSGDLAEDLMREAVAVLGSVSAVHKDAGAYVFVAPRLGKAVVAKWNGAYYSVVTVRPFRGDAQRLWGNPEWRGAWPSPSVRTRKPHPLQLATKPLIRSLGATGKRSSRRSSILTKIPSNGNP